MATRRSFIPGFLTICSARITQYPVDYLLLGQHYIHNEIDGAYVYEPTDDPEILKAYVDQCIAGLDTGLYTYLAHPDLIQLHRRRIALPARRWSGCVWLRRSGTFRWS